MLRALTRLSVAMLVVPTLTLRQQAGDGGQGDPPDPQNPPTEPQGGGGQQGGQGGGGQGDPPDSPRTFTQEELDRIATREKQRGEQAAQRQVAEDLGVSLDEAKRIITEHRTREESEKSEAQKARDQAEKEKADAEKAKADAARERYDTRVERALLRAGVPDDEGKLDRVKRMVTAEVDADQDAISADVAQLKEDFPQLFAQQQSNGGGRAPSGDPPGNPPKPKGGDDPLKRGAERAKQRFNRAQT